MVQGIPFYFSSDQNPFNLVQAHLVAPAVIELGGAGVGVVGHGNARTPAPLAVLLQRSSIDSQLVGAQAHCENP